MRTSCHSIVPDVSPAQKEKQSALPRGEIHSDEEDLPVQKTKTGKDIVGNENPIYIQ